jgi:hypothetical protein
LGFDGDINKELLRKGLAWWAKKFSFEKELEPGTRGEES